MDHWLEAACQVVGRDFTMIEMEIFPNSRGFYLAVDLP